MTEEEIRPLFRVVADPSWRVEYRWKGQWVVVSYCGSETTAKAALERHVARSVAWSNMTLEERTRSVLRNNDNP